MCVWVCVRGESQRVPSVHVTEVTDWLVLHYAQVVHGAAEGDLDRLADAGRASLHHFDFVYGLVHPQRNHLGSRKPLPEGEKDNISVTAPEQQRGPIFFPRTRKQQSLNKIEMHIINYKMQFVVIVVLHLQ